MPDLANWNLHVVELENGWTLTIDQYSGTAPNPNIQTRYYASLPEVAEACMKHLYVLNDAEKKARATQ